jgi:hypothetical protein
MPKKIFFESAVHQFVAATQELLQDLKTSPGDYQKAIACVDSWTFEYTGPKQMKIRWSLPKSGETVIDFTPAQFYTRGDSESFVSKQKARDLIDANRDQVFQQNRDFFKKLSRQVLTDACE